ncbi:hypothetical protein ACFQ88_29225 [Paenibacillus sp. NPDC056579]|uniref:hypothetical protein n=1 Tax=Paenibacillus sp. NPDC056579 TaxID=3345871 RepID=UPI0036ABC5F2
MFVIYALHVPESASQSGFRGAGLFLPKRKLTYGIARIRTKYGLCDTYLFRRLYGSP